MRMEPLLLFMASLAGGASSSLPCVPVASDHLAPTTSALDEHRALRKALGEPIPHSPTMIMLYGKGGHLSTEEYSIVLVRQADAVWRGTAVGRSRIWVKDAPYSPMKRVEWVLEKAAAGQLEDAISRRCSWNRAEALQANKSGPTPRDYIPERIDVITAGDAPITFYADEGDGRIAALIRPPR
ncbi:hypothetical protein ABVV53_17165 [Novosphingobium sp. RD2P27]|uniref:Uncharacterized protein n=1 Tax=Novosphingobium kalidii TaxID=3230299 RepID=A0ABV2D5M9_9SPHN